MFYALDKNNFTPLVIYNGAQPDTQGIINYQEAWNVNSPIHALAGINPYIKSDPRYIVWNTSYNSVKMNENGVTYEPTTILQN